MTTDDLRDLLLSSFAPDELRRGLRRFEGIFLPEPPASALDIADSAATQLVRMGLDRSVVFWRWWLKERPHRADVAEFRDCWLRQQQTTFHSSQDEPCTSIVRPLHLLFARFESPGTPHLDCGREFSRIEQRLAVAIGAGLARLTGIDVIQPGDLSRGLNEHHPDILHCCLHGLDEGLLFRGEAGQPAVFDFEQITRFVEAYQNHNASLSGIVFNACKSELAARRVSEFMTFAVGMADIISNEAALVFSDVFYTSLVNGAGPANAFDMATATATVVDASFADYARFFGPRKS